MDYPTKRSFAISLLLAAGVWAAAPATANVATFARNGDANGGNVVAAGYNTQTDPFFNVFDGPYGETRYGGCAANSIGCVATQDGTTGSAPTAVKSFSQTSLSDFSYDSPSTGSSFARADLNTGQLGVSVTGTFRSAFGIPSGISGLGRAVIGDTLTFSVAGADAATATDIGIGLDLHGIVAGADVNGIFVQSQLQFGNGYFLSQDNLPYDAQPSSRISGWKSYTLTPDSTGDVKFFGIYTLSGASTSLDFFDELFTRAGNGATSDFSHTSKLSLDLPSGVTFTSSSGAFLQNEGSGAVPEPSIWAMMFVGFGITGRAVRNAKRRVRDASAGIAPASLVAS